MDVDELYLLGSTTRTTIPAQPLVPELRSAGALQMSMMVVVQIGLMDQRPLHLLQQWLGRGDLFHTWSSSLCSCVLKSRTSFARFLRTTLHAERRLDSPSKALFPLPIPKLGVFQAKKMGSRARRRRAFDQALHICLMALNFLHSDFSPIPVESLCRIPSSTLSWWLWTI